MPAIVYHIGIFDKRDEPEYVKYVIKSQMMILSKCCKSADVYIGMHADELQIEMIKNIAKEADLKIKNTMSYQHDLWEVPTVEWLQNEIAKKYAPDDYISYMHSKGITNHDDKARNYLMDHLFVPYEDNLKYLREHLQFNAAVCCSYIDYNLKDAGFHYSCWTAKVSHVLNIPAPERIDERWASEHFMKLKLGEFLTLDNRMCVYRPETFPADAVSVPSQYMYGNAYNPSEKLREILLPLQTTHPIAATTQPPPVPVVNSQQKHHLHLIYGVPLAIVTLLFLTFFVLYLRK